MAHAAEPAADTAARTVGARRLTAEQRRAQLIEIGTRQVEASSFDALSTDAVAEEAGISRGLLFHYFPTRDDFLQAIAEHAAADLLERTEPDRSLPLDQQWRGGLERFVAFVEEHPDAYVSLIRGAVGRSAQLQGVVDATRGAFAARILETIGVDPETGPPRLRYLARGYVAFIEEVVVTWLRDDRGQGLDRQALIDVCEDAALSLMSVAGVSRGG